jgi:hypothetical protein
VSLSVATNQTVTVRYTTADGTATVANHDYEATSGTLNFAPGETHKNLTVVVDGDPRTEPNETFLVRLTSVVNATLANGQATGTIIKNHTPPAVHIAGVTQTVGNTGTTPFVFTVSLTNASSQTVSVAYSTADGTATATNHDYTATSGTLSFAPGTTSKTINVVVNGQPRSVMSETFLLKLANPANATLADRQATGTIMSTGQVSSSGPQVLLTPQTLTALKQMAAANTPQWQAFKQRLDGNLDVLIAENIGAYQGDELTWVSDYALGYQILKDTDPATADQYADKAIGLIKGGLDDYEKGSWGTRQFLARGDGTTRTFTLPNADLVPSTLNVSLSAVTTQPVVHGAQNGQDAVDYYETFLKVSDTSDGPANYTQGVDWSHNPDYDNSMIDWSLPGKEPAVGATYYVTSTLGLNANTTTAYTLNGDTITFGQAPAANQAVFVEYLYGTHAADGSSLAYQQTSAGDGGFNSIFIDDTYTYRYLGRNIAMGLDWLDGYAGLSPALEQQAEDLLVRWSDYMQTNGYLGDSVASNYGAADYASEVVTALALNHRSPDGPRLLSAALAYRQANVLPLLQNPTTSLAGGFWSEGWSYGSNAAQAMLLGSQALADAGLITNGPEQQWADQAIEDLVSEQPAANQLYDGGDWYVYPAQLPDKALFYSLANTADNAADRSYANDILQQYPDSAFVTPGDTEDYRDLLFHDPSATASFWSSLPLQHFASGTGLLTARSDWGSAPTWVSLQMGNLLNADHQTYSPGQLQISRGDDQLLINANAVALSGDESLAPTQRSQFSNVLAVNDNGAGYQRDPFSMGVWYGTPGVVVNHYEANSNDVYMTGDYHAAYSPDNNPGSGGPTSELTRSMVYVRPGYVFVYDRVTTLQASYAKQLRWHFVNAPTVNGNAFTETVGQSRLFGQTFSSVPLTTTVAPVEVDNNPQAQVYRVTSTNTNPTSKVRFLTVFQTAGATTANMDATEEVDTTDDRMEGSQIGNQLVLFGRDGTVDLTTAVTYTLGSGASSVNNLLTDLEAGASYQVKVNGAVLTSVVASNQGAISFTTALGAQTVQVTKTA